MIGLRRAIRAIAGQALFSGRRPSRLCFTVGNEVRLLKSRRRVFPALIERIDDAQHDISLETYIFANDDTGRAVSERFCARPRAACACG